jgi:hypothetical protein
MINVNEYNKNIKREFENRGGIDLLTKYVMSEILPPIDDFENAVNIIKTNYHHQMSGELLIIGAYLAIKWTYLKNELLEILNLMYDYFPDRDKAIINYLNALQIYTRDEHIKRNEEYRSQLNKSMGYKIPFVYNRCQMAEVVHEYEIKKCYEDALKNVEIVFSEQDIMQMPLEHFLDPQSFIKEYILGTQISYVNYEIIKEKIK